MSEWTCKAVLDTAAPIGPVRCEAERVKYVLERVGLVQLAESGQARVRDSQSFAEEEWRPHGRPFTTKRSGVLWARSRSFASHGRPFTTKRSGVLSYGAASHGRPFTTKRSGVLMGVRSRRRCRSAQDSGVGWALFPGNVTDKRSSTLTRFLRDRWVARRAERFWKRESWPLWKKSICPRFYTHVKIYTDMSFNLCVRLKINSRLDSFICAFVQTCVSLWMR